MGFRKEAGIALSDTARLVEPSNPPFRDLVLEHSYCLGATGPYRVALSLKESR